MIGVCRCVPVEAAVGVPNHLCIETSVVCVASCVSTIEVASIVYFGIACAIVRVLGVPDAAPSHEA